MKTPTDAGGKAPPRARRRLLLLGLLLGGAALAAGLGWYLWVWRAAPAPPDVPLAGAEPAIAQAVATAQAKVRQEPRSAAAWGSLGLLLAGNGYNKEANRCFARAEQLDPGDPRWPYLQGLWLTIHDRRAALPYLERGVERAGRSDPHNSTPRLQLAEVLLEEGRQAEAEAQLEQVEGQQPEDARLQFDLGLVAVAGGDLEGSITHLSRSAESPFSRQKAAAELAAVYQRRGDSAAAAACARRARQLPADLPWQDPYAAEFLHLEAGRQSRFKEVERLEGEGRLREGARLLREMTDAIPDARSHVALGITLVKLQDYEAAEQVLRTAVRQEPGKMQAHYFLCVALFQQAEKLRAEGGDRAAVLAKYRDAAASARRATELKPDHAFAHLFLGLCLKALGERSEALASLRQAARCRPELPEPHLHLGEMLVEDGADFAGLEQLREAAELSSEDDPQPRETLCRVWLQVVLRRALLGGL